jgi:hypothetical protein
MSTARKPPSGIAQVRIPWTSVEIAISCGTSSVLLPDQSGIPGSGPRAPTAEGARVRSGCSQR